MTSINMIARLLVAYGYEPLGIYHGGMNFSDDTVMLSPTIFVQCDDHHAWVLIQDDFADDPVFQPLPMHTDFRDVVADLRKVMDNRDSP